MSNDMTIYNPGKPAVKNIANAYDLDAGQGLPPVRLKRGQDFGVIPKTKKPSLFKAGAEKVALAYGLCQRYEIVSKIEQVSFDQKSPSYFYYLVRCDLVKIMEDKEYIICSSYGSANTSEKRNGFNGPHDAANGTLKMAQKRALVGAAIAIGGLSDMFSQDIENEEFMAEGQKDLFQTDDPEAPVTTKQIRRLYAIGGDAGLTAEEVKRTLAKEGFSSTKDIRQKDYERICNLLNGEAPQK